MTFWLIIFILILSIHPLFYDKLLVYSKVGLIRGLQAEDGDYRMFLGIPYATVNKSNLFGESIPHPYFETVFEADDDSAMCPQRDEFNHTLVGNLDCLHLNIYVPNTRDTLTDRLPVLAYIHGGYFEIGFSGRYVYGPKYLVRHGIILVTLNYRLGPYGFFCLDTPEVSGNQGFKDQMRALKWIYDNIAEFGGDTDRITLAGDSLGAMSIDFILHSLNDEKRMFDGAILQSNPYGPGGEVYKPDNLDPLRLAEYLGYKTDILSEALAYLAKVKPLKLIEVSIKLKIKYGLCLENAYENVKSFLSNNINLIKPAVQNMSILIGNTNRETLVQYHVNNPEYHEEYDPFKEYVELFDLDEKDSKDFENILRQFYIGDEIINRKVRNELLVFSNDAYFYHTAKNIMYKYINNGVKDIYYYIFAYNGQRNFLKLQYNISDEGAAHADELGYLFDASYMDNPTSDDQVIVDRITTLWANFIKYGNPTPTTSELLPVKWLPYTKNSQHYMKIDSQLTLGSKPFYWRMAFWDLLNKIYENMNIKHKKKYNSSPIQNNC